MFIKKVKTVRQLFAGIRRHRPSNVVELLNHPKERLSWIVSYSEALLGGKNSFQQKVPVDASGKPLPWYTYPAIEFINQLDLSPFSVFEFGSGNSSLFWASRVANVKSVETDRDWYLRFRDNKLENLSVELREKKEEYIAAFVAEPKAYDIVVIDGMFRYECAVSVARFARRDCLVIFDNTDWHPNSCAFLRDNGFLQIDFVGHGPINCYSWCTSLFFQERPLALNRRKSGGMEVIAGLRQTSETDKA